jgi:tRNA-splicing ligase RtcB
MAKAKKLIHNKYLPDRDLAVFLADSQEFKDYYNDLSWAQEYAKLNRLVIYDLYKNVLSSFWPSLEISHLITCHHNYVSREVHFNEDVLVTRKGAISAECGQYGIIPGSMGTKSYIVKGKGNPDSLNSASHGAGRRMSRGAAKRKYSVADLEKQTRGIECRKDKGVIDEIPAAYKDIDYVMENQKDLVEIEAELRQVLCVKG